METRIPTKLEIRKSVVDELKRQRRISIKNNDENAKWFQNLPKDLKLDMDRDFIYQLEYFQFWNSIKCHSNYLAYVADISDKYSPVVFSQIGLLS